MTGDSLAGSTALVTGASRGIGLAAARALAKAGVRVAMVARSRDALTAAAAEVGGIPITADVSEREAVATLAAEVRSRLGGSPDIIVNSAGSFSIASFLDTEPLQLEDQLAVNLRGPFLVTRAFLGEMVERGSGHVINVGSIAGRLAMAGNAAYSASKFALRGMHEVLAAELQGKGIRLTLIEPAATDTSLWDEIATETRDDLPSRAEMMRPEDVARAIVYAVRQPAGVEISHLALRSIGR